MPRNKSNLTHYLQLRLSNDAIAEIDNALATIPELRDFTRCGFIRHAIFYVLDEVAGNEHDKATDG